MNAGPMLHRFKWTSVSRRRNGLTAEYEPLQPYILLALVNRLGCRTFADVGSNVGAYAVLMSQAPSIERVIAFEANPHAVEHIRRNFGLNGIGGVVREAAVSSKRGAVTFGTVSRFAGNSAVVATAGGQDFDSVEDVEAVTLDDELADCPQPIALKIDVEGHERDVIAGASAILASARCVLQVENYAGGIDDLLPRDYRRLTQVGPDSYFTNIPDFDTVEIYEHAAAAMIEANHERKGVAFGRGDFNVEITGRSYELLRRIATRVLGSRL
jgi:FkbM family methyltransferase